MTEEQGTKWASIPSSELGSNCWLVCRFIQGSRCARVLRCNYPEKKTCKAVDAEIAYLQEKKLQAEEEYHARINKLIAEKEE